MTKRRQRRRGGQRKSQGSVKINPKVWMLIVIGLLFVSMMIIPKLR